MYVPGAGPLCTSTGEPTTVTSLVNTYRNEEPLEIKARV